MDSTRRTRSGFLLPALVLGLSLLSVQARAEPLALEPPEYQQTEPVRSTIEMSSVPVLLVTLFGVPPSRTIQEEIIPPTPPTVVVPTPPTTGTPETPENPGTPGTPGKPTDPGGPIITNHAPEPASLVSGLLGMGMVWFYRRRPRKRPVEKTELICCTPSE